MLYYIFLYHKGYCQKVGTLAQREHIIMLLTGGVVGFIIIVLAFNSIKGKISKRDILCDLKITMDKKSVYVKSIIDTGNFLKEPITGTPVIVAEKQELYGIIEKEVLENLSQIINRDDIETSEYMHKVRLIPFTSLGKENGILIGIKVDSITINFEDKNTYVEDVIIGIYDGKLSKTDKYKALIGLEILNQKELERV